MTDLILASTNVPSCFRSITFDDYDTDRGDPHLLDQVDSWRPTADVPSLLLIGKPGLGKTMLASALLNDYHSGLNFRTQSGDPLPPDMVAYLQQTKFPVYFIQLAELIRLHIRVFKLHDLVIRDLVEPTEYLELDQLLEDLKDRVEVLVIDDVGKEHRTGSNFAEDEFELLARTRANNGAPTIYTSNLPLSRWSTYSASMVNFIERTSVIVEFR